MNTNLLNIVKQIVYEKGENVLADPQKLNPLFKDYAKDEPKDERVAFGRCIEIGAYQELKNSTPADRSYVKSSLASRLQQLTGFNIGFCSSTVNLLEAVMYNVPQANAPTSVQSTFNSNPVYFNKNSYSSNTPTSAMAKAGFFIGLINLLQLIIIIMNRQNINLPEDNRAIIVLAWFVITVVLAITGFIVSKNGYSEGGKGFGIAGMAFNGLVILPVIIFFLGVILQSFSSSKKQEITHKFK
jgi:hypothetical protein